MKQFLHNVSKSSQRKTILEGNLERCFYKESILLMQKIKKKKIISVILRHL